MYYYTTFSTRFCTIILVGSNQGLTHLHMDTGKGNRSFSIRDDWQRNDAALAFARAEVEEYCRGERFQFSIPVSPQGTDFQQTVWKELMKIPYGEVRSYKDVARTIGNEKAARAVGSANNKNPIPLIIPCHRVIGANGSLAGFAHGLDIKQQLLDFEKLRT